MANTYVDYTAVAAQTDYNFSFEYLRDAHVKVKVNGSEVTNFTIVTSPVQLIRFNTAPAAGAAIKIYRDSRGDFSPLVDFVDGSILTENELDESYKHNLFIGQEASEGQGGEQLTKKGLEHYDAEGNKIINLFAPSDNTDAANKAYVDQTIDNAIALGGSPAIVSLGGYDVTASGSSEPRSLADRFAEQVNVLDYGADPTGDTDSTDAFNRALKASADYATQILNKHQVELQLNGGYYKVEGTVYVRKGQVISGGGCHIFMGSTGSFKLGFNSHGTQDTGGYPITMQDLFLEGGFRPIDAQINGYQILNCFISFSALGPRIDGSDGIVSNCTFDDGSTLLSLRGRNQVVDNCNFFVGNQQINIGECRDSVISNCVFNYAEVCSIDWRGAETENLKIVGCSFIANNQHASTFDGFIRALNDGPAPTGELMVRDCSFRNCFEEAINLSGTSPSGKLDIQGCIFDGNKTFSTYTQSTTMKAIAIKGASSFDLTVKNCKFQNLLDTPLTFTSSGTWAADVFDCEFVNNAGTESIEITGGPDGSYIYLGNIKGEGASKDLITLSGSTRFLVKGWLKDWLKITDDGTYDVVNVPYGGSSLIDVTLIANPNPAGNNLYRTIKNMLFSVTYDFSGSLITQLSNSTIFSSTSPLGLSLNLQGELGSVGGGSQVSGVQGPNVIAIYYPNSYGNPSIDVQFKETQRKAL